MEWDQNEIESIESHIQIRDQLQAAAIHILERIEDTTEHSVQTNKIWKYPIRIRLK